MQIINDLKEDYEKLEELESDLLERQISFLNSIFESLEPLLEDLGDKIVDKVEFKGKNLTRYKETYRDKKGILLLDEFYKENTGTRPMAEKAKGRYEGFQVWLTSDGLKEFVREGSWGKWQSYKSGWEIKETSTISIEELLERFDFEDVLDKLNNWLEEKSVEDEIEKTIEKLKLLDEGYNLLSLEERIKAIYEDEGGDLDEWWLVNIELIEDAKEEVLELVDEDVEDDYVIYYRTSDYYGNGITVHHLETFNDDENLKEAIKSFVENLEG